MRARVAVVALASSAIAACAPSSSPPATTATVPPSPSATAGQAVVSVTERDNGGRITVRRFDTVRVQLSSTYWRFALTSNPGVLEENGGQSFSPQPSGCVPGAGCGTVTDNFLALSVGEAVVIADRSTCGEALLCQGSAGHYRLTVTVTG
jgi:hypothetical protein